jgi:CheY-like chemotaxis protein
MWGAVDVQWTAWWVDLMPYSAANTSHPRAPADGPARFVLWENGHELLLYQFPSAERALTKLDSALGTARGLLGARIVEVARTRFEAVYECRTPERVWQLAVVRLKRVVVADAHPLIRRLLLLTLAESIPCEILEAADGVAALALTQKVSPALVVLAVELPQLTGDAVARTLRADAATRDIPVILISTHPATPLEYHARTVGAAGYFRKPFNPLAVREAVRTLLVC